MKKELARHSRLSYKDAVWQTAEHCGVPPEIVDKIIRKFWRATILHVIFGLGSITIAGFGKIKPTVEHMSNRSIFLKIRKKIYNRKSDEVDTRKEKKKTRTLLFSEYH